MASDMDLEQQEREEELKRLEEDVKNSDVALDKLNSEYEEQMDEMAEEPEQEHGKVWLFFGKLHKALEKNLGRNIIIGVYAITVIRIIADLVMFMRGVFYVDYAMVPRNFFYYFFSIVIPYAVWIWSTKQSFTFFAFTNRKMRGLWIASISLCTVILNVMFLCTCMVAVPLIMLIPVSPDVTGSMIVNLTRLITFMLPVFVFSSCIKGFIDIYQFTGTKELIYKFKVDRNLDLRRNKASCYDYAIARDRKTGRIYRVAEVIRTMHLLIIGATGSGKTSMNFLPGIANDLNTRVKNENTQKKKVQQMGSRSVTYTKVYTYNGLTKTDDIPAVVAGSVRDEATNEVSTINMTQTGLVKKNEQKSDDFVFSINVVSGAYFMYKDNLVEYNAENPNLMQYKDSILEDLGLSKDIYTVESIEWTSEPEADADGMIHREATVKGYKEIADYEATYVATVDYPTANVVYTADYEADTTKNTTFYEIKGTATYQLTSEIVDTNASGTKKTDFKSVFKNPVVVGSFSAVVIVIIAVIAIVLWKKKSEKEVVE